MCVCVVGLNVHLSPIRRVMMGYKLKAILKSVLVVGCECRKHIMDESWSDLSSIQVPFNN